MGKYRGFPEAEDDFTLDDPAENAGYMTRKLKLRASLTTVQ